MEIESQKRVKPSSSSSSPPSVSMSTASSYSVGSFSKDNHMNSSGIGSAGSSPSRSPSSNSTTSTSHTPSSSTQQQGQQKRQNNSGESMMMNGRPSPDCSAQRQQKQRPKDQLNELISCQICGDTSTGFHYGVHSCEGCKGFFRRSISQHTTYTCTNKEACEISIYTRNQCQLCRWKKCLTAGMSKDASRLGRRSKRMIERMQDMITMKQENPEKKMKGDYMRQPWGSSPGMFNHVNGEKGQTRFGSGFYNTDGIQIKSENPQSACAYERYGSKDDSRDFPEGCGKDGQMGFGFPMSPNSASNMASSSLSNIKGISAEAINKMLLSGQPVILIPQQIGSASQTMAINGQIPPAVVVVNQPKSDSGDAKGVGSDSQEHISQEEQKVPGSPNFKSTNLFPEHPRDNKLESPFFSKPQKPGQHTTSAASSPSQKNDGSPQPTAPLSAADAEELPLPPFDVKELEQSPSPNFSHSLSPFSLSAMNSPGKFFPFDTPTPSPQDSSKAVPSIPQFEVDCEEPTPEQKIRLSKLCTKVAKTHHDICHFTYARIRMLKAKYYGIFEPTTDSKGRELHDCSRCPPPPDFPTSELPPKELDMPPEELTAAHMVQFFANKFTGLITRIVIFTKQIPGFRSLHRDDQVTLIKCGLFEVAAVRFTTVMDLNSNMVHYWTTGDSFSKDAAIKSPLGSIIDLLYDFARRFSQFELTDDEIAMLNAVIMVAADRPGLKNREAVQALQGDLLKGLQIQLQTSHPDDPNLFARVLTTIPKLREIGPEHIKRLMELKVQNPLLTKLSPLHAEVFNLTD